MRKAECDRCSKQEELRGMNMERPYKWSLATLTNQANGTQSFDLCETCTRQVRVFIIEAPAKQG